MARYRLRWCFEYNDGKRPRRGIWSNSDDAQTPNGAWAAPKENLARALIEYEDIETWKIGVFAECHGADFVNFEWIVTSSINPSAPEGIYRGHVVGIEIRTRDVLARAFIDGSQQVRPLLPEEKTIKLVGCR